MAGRRSRGRGRGAAWRARHDSGRSTANFPLASVTQTARGAQRARRRRGGRARTHRHRRRGPGAGSDRPPPDVSRLRASTRRAATRCSRRPRGGSTPTLASSCSADLVAHAVDMPFGRYFHESLVRPLGLTRHASRRIARSGRRGVGGGPGARRQPSCSRRPAGSHSATLADAASGPVPGHCEGFCRATAARTRTTGASGFEIRSGKQPHWTGTHNSPSTYGHFGLSGSMFWVDPERRTRTGRARGPFLRRLGQNGLAGAVRRRSRGGVTASARRS